jgi:hypothetical protein
LVSPYMGDEFPPPTGITVVDLCMEAHHPMALWIRKVHIFLSSRGFWIMLVLFSLPHFLVLWFYRKTIALLWKLYQPQERRNHLKVSCTLSTAHRWCCHVSCPSHVFQVWLLRVEGRLLICDLPSKFSPWAQWAEWGWLILQWALVHHKLILP